MRKVLLLILIFFLQHLCIAQQGNTWYFGFNAGITFNTDPPSMLTDGVLQTLEGCATMSDSLGNILFYTDGSKVYNRLHQVMPNGGDLMGHFSSSNSAVIVPQPGSDSLYYIFTSDASENLMANGYRYSVVDMSLESGLGNITTKNQLIYGPNTEKLTAVPHANGVDIWVITISWTPSAFVAYKVDCNGINPTPVVSEVGQPYIADERVREEIRYNDGVGCLKVSPDYKKIATARTIRNIWELFDFDNATGVVSNPLLIPSPPSFYGAQPFGVEFSPNSKLVYISGNLNTGEVHQYKVDVHDSATIADSRYEVTRSPLGIGAAQLGPDGKIYIANAYDTALSVIHQPDRYGAACAFERRAISTGDKFVGRGLPVFYGATLRSLSDFTYTQDADCRTVRFSATSALPPPLTWEWTFSDGTTATGQTVTHVFPESGNDFTVTLKVTNEAVCGARNKKIKVIRFDKAVPKAKLGANTQCGSTTVAFADSSTVGGGSVAGWLWEFDDGSTSTDRHPVHTYPAFGKYRVKLTITASDFCRTTDTIAQWISVNEKPVASFSWDKACLNEPTTFTERSTISSEPINGWSWDFGDGQISSARHPQHTFISGQLYTVTLVAHSANGCTDTASLAISPTSKPVADFSFSPACSGKAVSFTDGSSLPGTRITTWHWNFADAFHAAGKDTAVEFSTPGYYTVKHVAVSEGGCPSDTVSKVVEVEARPEVVFAAQTECGSKTVSSEDQSTAPVGAVVSWHWDFGGGATSGLQHPEYTFSDFGIYTVKLAAGTRNGCLSDTLTQTVAVAAKPVVQFNLPKVCLLDAYAQFVNTTSVDDNSTLSYRWHFGDFNAVPAGSDVSTQSHPQYRYSAAAQYNVKLVAASSQGCTDSLTRTFTVNGAVPKARFTIEGEDRLCSNTDVVLEDQSVVDFGSITRIKILWGDGDSTVDNAPLLSGNRYAHRYPYFGSPGTKTYSITMYAYSGGVCVDVTTRDIQLYAAPQVRFASIGEVCLEAPAFTIMQASEVWGLSGSGRFAGTGITDPVTGRFDPRTAGTGSHSITYQFTTPEGCRADSAQVIEVNAMPSAAFSVQPACLPDAALQFTSHSAADGYPTGELQHSWKFGNDRATDANPNTSSDIHPVHRYTSLDTFAVSLRVTSPKGCVNDTMIKVLPSEGIYAQPVASFSQDPTTLLCQGLPAAFVQNSDSMGKNLTRWWWNFGDGQQDSIHRNPVHVYSTAGTYTVSLKVENANGCSSEVFSHDLLIESIPAADFSFDTTCYGKPVQFTDRSTNAFGAIVSWQWDFNDGTTAQSQHPNHIYTSYRDYSVRLKVVTGNGCTSPVFAQEISINPVFIQAGSDTVGSIGQPVQLRASGARTYQWSPSLGLSNAAVADPMASLTRDQEYVVKGTTEEGCIGYDTVRIKVFDKADIYVPNAFTPNRDGLNDYLRPTYVGIRDIAYFTVYNRWGEIVFTTRDMHGRWDGRVKSNAMPSGTYVWIARGTAYDGRAVERKGTVTVIR